MWHFPSFVYNHCSLWRYVYSVFSETAVLFAGLAEMAGRMPEVLAEAITEAGKAVIADLISDLLNAEIASFEQVPGLLHAFLNQVLPGSYVQVAAKQLTELAGT